MRRTAVSVLALLILTACGAAQSYRLPVAAHKAYDTFAPIASVAQAKGLRVAELDSSVHVELDETMWVYYTVQNDKYNMVLHLIKEEAVPESERKDKFAWAKKEADAIWKEAMKAYQQTTAPVIIREGDSEGKKGFEINVNL